MPRQISDEEFNYLQGRRQVADFVESIYNDPQLQREAKALIKKKYPNMVIPDYDIENRVEQRFDREKQEREAQLRETREKEEEAKFQAARSKVQKDYGFTADAMGQLEQLMIDRNIGDYEVAAEYMAAKQPKTSEATIHDNRWAHDKQDTFKEIAADPEAWGRAEILKAIHNDSERSRNGR